MMGVKKPYRRTCRQFADGHYSERGRWRYLIHPAFATEPRHYIRAFLLLQQDVFELFSYVEPADANLQTYSHRIQQLLTRACIEIEANFKAIFLDNNAPGRSQDWNIQDYKKIDRSHRLSSFVVRVPAWRGEAGWRRPFASWENDDPLTWYQAYNRAKHDRHANFYLANFESLTDAFTGLNVLLSAQFMGEDYGPGSRTLALSGNDSDMENDEMVPSIGGRLRIRFPTDWPVEQRYDFDWGELAHIDDPFENYPY